MREHGRYACVLCRGLPWEVVATRAAVRKRRRGEARRTFQLVVAQKRFLLPPRVCRRGTAGSRDQQDKGCFACTPMSLIKTVAGRCPFAAVCAPRWARCAVDAAIAAAAGRAIPRSQCAITPKHFCHQSINMSTSTVTPAEKEKTQDFTHFTRCWCAPPKGQSPSPPRSLVRDGQTSPHRPRLVVSRSTCPPISPPPPCKQLCTRSCSNKHTQGSIPKREEPGKTGAPCVKVPGSSRVPSPAFTSA
jgi:hypothetical protein